jgi:hypothetical protein
MQDFFVLRLKIILPLQSAHFTIPAKNLPRHPRCA